MTHYDSTTGSVNGEVVKKCLDADSHSHLSEEKNKYACEVLLSKLIGNLNVQTSHSMKPSSFADVLYLIRKHQLLSQAKRCR